MTITQASMFAKLRNTLKVTTTRSGAPEPTRKSKAIQAAGLLIWLASQPASWPFRGSAYYGLTELDLVRPNGQYVGTVMIRGLSSSGQTICASQICDWDRRAARESVIGRASRSQICEAEGRNESLSAGL